MIIAASRFIPNDYFFSAAYTVLQFIILATAWNILGGYTGYVNFGSAAFFATGAYSTVFLYKALHPPLLVMIVTGSLTAGLLGLAVGARTVKMPQGHHGANHPVKDFTTGKVEIVSMNHGFAVDRASLPANAEETHVSLFDGSNCGIALADRPAFSVQYHPEASPGPRDSYYLFRRFVDLIAASKAAEATRAA